MKFYSLFLVVVIIISCGKDEVKTIKSSKKTSVFSISKKHDSVVSVKAIFKEQIEDWEELQNITNFLQTYRNVSPNEVLNNALELVDLTKSLRDSVVPEVFDKPSFKARVNVFYNETLRLADLTRIPSITIDDINKQVNKTISSFSNINTKINTVLEQKRFEDEIDVNLVNLKIDTTKIDSVTKKAINSKNIKEKQQLVKSNFKKPVSIPKN